MRYASCRASTRSCGAGIQNQAGVILNAGCIGCQRHRLLVPSIARNGAQYVFYTGEPHAADEKDMTTSATVGFSCLSASRTASWADGVSGQDRSLRGNSLGLRKSRHYLRGEAADVLQRHVLRHAAEVEGPREDSEPQHVAPASHEVDAALRISRNYGAPRDLLRGLEPFRLAGPRGVRLGSR